MPASYVHQSIAMKAFRSTGRTVSGQCFAAYLSGCEGPDPLFYGFYRGKPGMTVSAGVMMHTEQTETFLCSLIDNVHSELEQSYALGFLTHYAADTVIHPFVYGHSLTDNGIYSANLHGIIEHAYEIVRYRRNGHPTGIPEQLLGIRLLSPQSLTVCTHLFAAAMKATYPERFIEASALNGIFKASVQTAHHLRSDGGHKYRLTGVLPFGLDQTAHAHMIPPEIPKDDLWNDAHLPWSSIFEPTWVRTESLDDLYSQAVSRAAELITAAYSVFDKTLSLQDFTSVLGCLSYNSGLPWRETPDAKKAPGCTQRSG